MKKPSGLADSPFFSSEPSSTPASVSVFQGETRQPNEGECTEIRTDNRATERLNIPIKRRTKRYSFEFYDDQLLKLKTLKHRAEMRGERVYLSDMVREALDYYLRDR